MSTHDAGRDPLGGKARGSAHDPLRVLFANNYDMARARAGWQAGTYPSHHLYGTARLGEEFDVVDLPFSTEDRLGRVTELTRRKLGDVGQQLAAIRRRGPGPGQGLGSGRGRGLAAHGRGADTVIYGAAAQELRGLALLRSARLLSTPIVGVFHSAPSSLVSRESALRGFDHAITLTEHTRREMRQAGMPAERMSLLGWGAELDFPGFAPRGPASPDAPIVAAGKTGRDMRTLLGALAATGHVARIYGDRVELERVAAIPSQVTILPVSSNDSSTAPMRYDEAVMADLRSAAVVAIALSSTDRLTGLTEVVDVLACGRPMILTRSPYFDFDIEEIGCGWWVEPGDVRGWSERLSAAMSDRDRLDRMGRAGRAWAERHLNADLFTAGLRRVLRACAAPRG